MTKSQSRRWPEREARAFAAFAAELADASREIIQPAFREYPEVEVKADSTPVTAIDRQVERRLREMIAERFPDHGVLGEEFGASDLEAEYVWVLDPIDGTIHFIAGNPLFGSLIALTRDGVPLLGVIDHAITGDRWIGADGLGTTRNGRAVRVRGGAALDTAFLTSSNPDYFGPQERPAFERLRAAVRWTLYGGSCYAYGLLASGRSDLAVDAGLEAVDLCALVPVVEGAGGVITDWRGAPVTLKASGQVLAAGDAALHAAALRFLQSTDQETTR